MQNIEESLAALTFPEPEPVAVSASEPETQPEAVVAPVRGEPVAVAPVAEPAKVEEMPAPKKQAETKKEKKQPVEILEDDEHAKDGVALDELFKIKPELFQNAEPEEDVNGEKKKGKKGKKKAVELEFDEDLGEVVGRKIHKRGGEVDGDWE